MSQDYQSIFFNTARVKRVSYMSKEESAEVLRKPVGDPSTGERRPLRQDDVAASMRAVEARWGTRVFR